MSTDTPVTAGSEAVFFSVLMLYMEYGNIERFAFYEEAKTAYCIISTSEKALYANVMLQKGVVINN